MASEHERSMVSTEFSMMNAGGYWELANLVANAAEPFNRLGN